MIWFLFLAAFLVGCADNPLLTAAAMVAVVLVALHALGCLPRLVRS